MQENSTTNGDGHAVPPAKIFAHAAVAAKIPPPPSLGDAALTNLRSLNEEPPKETDTAGSQAHAEIAKKPFRSLKELFPEWIDTHRTAADIEELLLEEFLTVKDDVRDDVVDSLLLASPSSVRTLERLGRSEEEDRAVKLSEDAAELVGRCYIYSLLARENPIFVRSLAEQISGKGDSTNFQPAVAKDTIQKFYAGTGKGSNCPLTRLLTREYHGKNNRAETLYLRAMLEPYFQFARNEGPKGFVAFLNTPLTAYKPPVAIADLAPVLDGRPSALRKFDVEWIDGFYNKQTLEVVTKAQIEAARIAEESKAKEAQAQVETQRLEAEQRAKAAAQQQRLEKLEQEKKEKEAQERSKKDAEAAAERLRSLGDRTEPDAQISWILNTLTDPEQQLCELRSYLLKGPELTDIDLYLIIEKMPRNGKKEYPKVQDDLMVAISRAGYGSWTRAEKDSYDLDVIWRALNCVQPRGISDPKKFVGILPDLYEIVGAAADYKEEYKTQIRWLLRDRHLQIMKELRAQADAVGEVSLSLHFAGSMFRCITKVR